VTGDDHHHHADGQDQDVAVLDDQVRDVDRRERDAVGRDLEEQHDHDQRDEEADLAELPAEVRDRTDDGVAAGAALRLTGVGRPARGLRVGGLGGARRAH
jgi:hypothetical protein